MSLKVNTSKLTHEQLPTTGFARAGKLLPHLPFGRSTLWAWSKDGERFPASLKIGSMTCWRLEDVHAWFAAQGKVVLDAANDAGGQ